MMSREARAARAFRPRLSIDICPLRSSEIDVAALAGPHLHGASGMVMLACGCTEKTKVSGNRTSDCFVGFGLSGLAASLLVAILVLQANAMSPQTADFLRSAGLDPNSEAVRIADADGQISVIFHGDPETFSLEGLAAQRKTNAVKGFVATRAFIRRLKTDFANTRFAAPGGLGGPVGYNPDFLTEEERALVRRKGREEQSKGR